MDPEAQLDEQRRMLPHRIYRQYRSKNYTGALTGSYLIVSEQLSKNWGGSSLSLSLSIHQYPDGSTYVEGDFDLSCLEGVIRLNNTSIDTSQHAAMAEPAGNFSMSQEIQELIPDYTVPVSAPIATRQISTSTLDLTALEDFAKPHASGEILALQSQFLSSLTSEQRTLLVTCLNKKQEAQKQNLKHYFQWRGQETGEGEIEVDTGENRGYIEFEDTSYLVFHGKMYIPCAGTVEISGYKTSDVAPEMTRNWDDYSEAAHEFASVARWK